MHARAVLDAWRGEGADRMDPVRFHRIDALERRATGHDAEVRRLLDGRLSELIGAYANDLEAAAQGHAADGTAAPAPSARGAMGELLDHIAAESRDGASATDDMARHSAFPELRALDDIRKIWTRVRAERQFRQSLEDAPADAGPLNSGRLVHRSLILMSELSPGYLQQFLSYVEALTWMEQMNANGALSSEDMPRASGGSRRAKPRR
jgi:hypothetical protein